MEVKVCPFTLSGDRGTHPRMQCVGPDCLNFEWRLGGPMENNQYTLLLGSCSYFDRWTGHQQPNLANMTPLSNA